ncbi:uncharacterized protein LOC142356990 isoform X2 [Convolutriloba macropyga]|uniref:uncharacterized protein LOC142356990 isoform X2 n=1 Tax=Convolutriloba macropyga TaxID=536237 RepID=UPI003F52053D
MGRQGGKQQRAPAAPASGRGHSLRPSSTQPPTMSAKSSSSGAGMDALCDVAHAAADAPARFDSQATPVPEVVQVEAFSSIHDMIHAAILQFPPHASLQQIYHACQRRGRIAYKRSGGSRLITHNDNWKSQIRHALYTSGRFSRVQEGQDAWQLAKGNDSSEPSVTMVNILADDLGASGSVCGEASHGGVAAEGEGAGMQVTSRTGAGTRNGGGVGPGSRSKAPAAAGGSGPTGKSSGIRSTRSRRARTPAVRAFGMLATNTKTPEVASRVGSKDDTMEYDDGLEETESVAGYSQYGGPMCVAENNAGQQLAHTEAGGSRAELGHGESAHLEEGATAGKAVAESCSHQRPGLSDPSADSSSPRHKRQTDDSTVASQEFIPIKKRLKAAAVQRASAEAEKLERPLEPERNVADDVTPLMSKRDHTRNRRKPDRGATPLASGALPLTPVALNTGGAAAAPQTVEADEGAKKTRGRPPKPTQTPGVTLRPRLASEQVDTPSIVPPDAVAHPTPTTNPTPPSGFVPRVTRRMSGGQRSPSPASDQPAAATLSYKPDHNVFKAAALSVLRQLRQPMTVKELTREVLGRGLGCPAGRTPEHTLAATLYLDMQNADSPFDAAEEGKFGLHEWK